MIKRLDTTRVPLALALAVLATGVATAGGSEGGITGRVVDTVLQEPVSGAAVTVVGSNQTATTGPDGIFRVSGIAAPEVQFLVAKEGYRSPAEPVTAHASADGSIGDLVLTLEVPETGVFTLVDGKLVGLSASPATKVGTESSGSRPVDVFALRGLPHERIPTFDEPPVFVVRRPPAKVSGVGLTPIQAEAGTDSVWRTIPGSGSAAKLRLTEDGLEIVQTPSDAAGGYTVKVHADGRFTWYPFWINAPPQLTLHVDYATETAPEFAKAVAEIREFCGDRYAVCRAAVALLKPGLDLTGYVRLPDDAEKGQLLFGKRGETKAAFVTFYRVGAGWNVADISAGEFTAIEGD